MTREEVGPCYGGGYVRRHGGVIAAVAFAGISIAITVFNKAVASEYHFTCNLALTLCQAVLQLVALRALHVAGIISLPPLKQVGAVALHVAPLSLLLVAKIVTSMVSLSRASIPMFNSLRQLSVVFVLVEEWWLLGSLPSRGIIASVAVICGGATVAAMRDLTFDASAYAYIGLTNTFASLYAVYIVVAAKRTGLNVWGLLYVNSLITVPWLLVLASTTGDMTCLANFPRLTDIGFQLAFQASIGLAFALNVATFFTTTLNSALTKTVVGGLKNVVTIVLGIALFRDYRWEPVNFAGMCICFAGGVAYSVVAYLERDAGDGAAATAAAAAVAVAAADGSGGSSDGKGRHQHSHFSGGRSRGVWHLCSCCSATSSLSSSSAAAAGSGQAGSTLSAGIQMRPLAGSSGGEAVGGGSEAASVGHGRTTGEAARSATSTAAAPLWDRGDKVKADGDISEAVNVAVAAVPPPGRGSGGASGGPSASGGGNASNWASGSASSTGVHGGSESSGVAATLRRRDASGVSSSGSDASSSSGGSSSGNGESEPLSVTVAAAGAPFPRSGGSATPHGGAAAMPAPTT